MFHQELYMSAVFIAGLVSFFSPCILPVLPVYIGILTGEIGNGGNGEEKSNEDHIMGKLLEKGLFRINWKLMKNTMVFVMGLSTSFILLGFGAGALGALISSQAFYIGIGAVVIFLGIHQTGWIRIPLLERQKKVEIARSNQADLFGIFLLGFTFSFGWTPCIGPVLGAILGISASSHDIAYSILLLSIYVFGLMLPFVVISLFSEVLLKRVKKLKKYMGKMKVFGGIIIILMGVLLMFNQLNLLIALFT